MSPMATNYASLRWSGWCRWLRPRKGQRSSARNSKVRWRGMNRSFPRISSTMICTPGCSRTIQTECSVRQTRM
ncbi:MAG: gallidermin family lantibiotic [Mesorhizobium sp.]